MNLARCQQRWANMIRLLMMIATLSPRAFAGSCSSEAAAQVNAFGGFDLVMERDDVRGWGVNASGYVSYTYLRGNQECYLTYYVSGTYFGPLCSPAFGRENTPNCGRLGTWRR